MSWCSFLWSNQLVAKQNAAPEGVEIALTTWPSADPAASNYLKPGGFFAITVDCQNVPEAAGVVNFFANDYKAGRLQSLIGSIMPAANVAAESSQYLNEISQKSVAYINNVVTPNCSALPEAEPNGSNEFFAGMLELEEQLCYGTMTAAEAAAALHDLGHTVFD